MIHSLLELWEGLSCMVGDHQAGAAHTLGLVCQQAAALEVRVVGHDKACVKLGAQK